MTDCFKIGSASSFLDALPRDNATTFGKLQEKIFELLKDESKLTKQERDFLVSVYYQYQSNRKLSKKQIVWVLDIYDKHINVKEDANVS